MSFDHQANHRPLKPAVFHILLALSETDQHGLGIAQAIEEATEGSVRLGPGTLYRSLKEMRRDGLVEGVMPPDDDADPRRKFYRLTAVGRALLVAEVRRYERIVALAKDRSILGTVR